MLRIFALIAVLLWSIPAQAQSNVVVNYKDNDATGATTVTPNTPLPIGGGFLQTARAPDFSATTTSGTSPVSMGATGNTARVCNTGAVTAYVALGGSTVSVTAANGFPIVAGSCANLNAVGSTYFVAIVGSTTATIQISVGSGIAALGGGGGGSSAPSGAAGGALKGTYPSPSLADVNSIATSLALGGATIGSNALAVTGTALFNGVVTFAGSQIMSGGGSLTLPGNLVFSAATGQIQLTSDTLITRGGAAATIQLGALDAAVAVAQTLRVQSVAAGTAAANGANWTFIGSLPTGTGTSGDIIFQTGVKTGSGTTQGTPTTALTIKGETQLVNASVGFAQGANTGIASCTAATLGATVTIKGGIVTAMTGC